MTGYVCHQYGRAPRTPAHDGRLQRLFDRKGPNARASGHRRHFFHRTGFGRGFDEPKQRRVQPNGQFQSDDPDDRKQEAKAGQINDMRVPQERNGNDADRQCARDDRRSRKGCDTHEHNDR